MEISEIEDKFDKLEGNIENTEGYVKGLEEAVGALASAILEQYKHGPVPPEIVAWVKKYSKWGTKK